MTGLIGKIRELTQFPFGRRRLNYQSYVLDGAVVNGSRDTLYRFGQMRIPEDLSGRSVLDLGCNLGEFCFECWRRGARDIVGIDNRAEYLDCARMLAAENGHCRIDFIHADLGFPNDIFDITNEYFGKRISIVFALSIYKHIGDVLWDILGGTGWETCYVESSRAKDGFESRNAKRMEKAFELVSGKFERLAITTDRSTRCVWRLHGR